MKKLVPILPILILAFSALAQPTSEFAAAGGERYWVQEDITYGVQNNTQLKLDVWYPHSSTTPTPTLVYFHGGGWIFGTKEGSVLQFLPFLEKGWRVVNVEYRMASNSLAPAAVEDSRCALRWIFRNANGYKFDKTKIVLMGHSAGGHLSLITGMLPASSTLDNNCFASTAYGDEPLRVAAIVNWYGITDVNDLIRGENIKNYAVMWMGSQTNAEEIAKRVSPLTYVRKDVPPILTIHGDNDSVVPYSQAIRLKAALDKVAAENELFTVEGGGHGGFASNQYNEAYKKVWKFLSKNIGS
ncbi:MAG: alpha/beta fold hydrolase [Pyrinomonadaceae bacterium]